MVAWAVALASGERAKAKGDGVISAEFFGCLALRQSYCCSASLFLQENPPKKKDSEREQSEQTKFLEGLWLFALFAPLEKNEAHGQTVGQRTGEEVVGTCASRAPERASTSAEGCAKNLGALLASRCAHHLA